MMLPMYVLPSLPDLPPVFIKSVQYEEGCMVAEYIPTAAFLDAIHRRILVALEAVEAVEARKEG